jgi:hypothetical protein
MNNSESNMGSGSSGSRWLKTADRIARLIGWFDRDLYEIHVPGLVKNVARRVGLNDYGDGRFREGLDALSVSIDNEKGLSCIGRLMIKATLQRYLSNRLLIQETLQRHPEICEEKINRPLFIVGLNRTGTTLLHNLLALAPDARAPRTWELMQPAPRCDLGSIKERRRVRKTRRLLWLLNKAAPELRIIHPIGATDFEECYPLVNHSFASPAFTMHYGLSGYADWLKTLTPETERWVYREYRSQLQILQAGSLQLRWILKSAVHLYFLRAVLDVFPDALIVQTHRNPIQMIPSLCSMVFSLRKIVYSRVSRESLGWDSLNQIREVLKRGVTARVGIDSRRILDIDFEDLTADPIGQVRWIHEYFNLGWQETHEQHMRRWLATNPPSKHGVHRYNPAQFGLNEELIASQLGSFGAYKTDYHTPL